MTTRKLTCLAILLMLAGAAVGATTSRIVTDGSTARTVYEVDDSQAGTYEVFQSSGVTACLNPLESNSDTYFSAVIRSECAPLGLSTPALPRVMLFSAAVQKQGPCPLAQGHCITGYIYLRIHGYWQGSLVLSTNSSANEPNQTLTFPIPADNYESITIRLAGGYSNAYSYNLRILGSVNELVKETSRTVQVVPQPAGQTFGVASAEYASYQGENVTAVVSHISPRSLFCARLTFANAYAYQANPQYAFDFFGGPFVTTAAPSEFRLGSNCVTPQVLLTSFTRLQETPIGGGGGGAGGDPPSTRWERLALQ